MTDDNLLMLLIRARTSLKCENPKGALLAIRQAIAMVDPDRSREMRLRGEAQPGILERRA